MRTWLFLAGFVAVCLAAGGLGALVTRTGPGTWYASLTLPSFTPPGAVFGPVWTALYIVMGTAAWLVWRKGGPDAGGALTLFFMQLALNVVWSYVFFGLRWPGLAAAEIVLLWAFIGAAIAVFWRIRRPAALLMLPYWAWVTFAAVLTFFIWRSNPGHGR